VINKSPIFTHVHQTHNFTAYGLVKPKALFQDEEIPEGKKRAVGKSDDRSLELSSLDDNERL